MPKGLALEPGPASALDDQALQPLLLRHGLPLRTQAVPNAG